MSAAVSILPATPADVPAMASISGAAFANDRNTRVKGLQAQVRGMADGLAHWLSIPGRVRVMKAVEGAGGELVGWVAWGYEGYEEGRGQESGEEAAAPTEEQTPPADASPPKPEPKTPVERLEALTSADLARWQDGFMPPGTKCMFVVALAVHPAHQSRGVGSALIRWGTQRADADGLFCWVHASEGGYRAFERAGFGEVGRLEVDLDEYAEGGAGGCMCSGI